VHGDPPVHEHVGAPLHVTTQSPPVQAVIVQLCALWHVSRQLPPEQSVVQFPPVQSTMQSPEPGQLVVHDWVLVQVCWQSPPGQMSEHVEPDSQVYTQSPLPGHVPVHVVLGGQSHTRLPPSIVQS